MGTYDIYKTDKAKEEDGAWVTFVDGSKWLIVRGNSSRARRALEAAQRPHRSATLRSQRQNKALPEAITDEINMNWTVNALVLGWKGVTGPDGKALTFNEKNLRQILTDLPDIHLDVLTACGEISNYQDQMDEETVGNSQKTSSSS